MKSAMRLVFPLLLALWSASAAASRTVHDELNRAVIVSDHPHRLICLAPSITDTIYAMGSGADIVGITDYTKYPPQAIQKPSVGGVLDPSMERLAALRPDLVLAIGDLTNSSVIQSIEQMGIPVFVIFPHGIAGIYHSIRSIGTAINQEQSAAALITRLRAREKAVRERIAGKNRPSVFFLVWADPIITAGPGAFITELIEAAGGSSVTQDLRTEWPRIGLETLIARQPQYVLLTRDSGISLKSLRQQPGWRSLDAITTGRVLYVDDYIKFPGPAAFEALEDLAKQLHP